MKRLYQILGFSILVLYFPVIMAFVSVDKDGVMCREVRSEISDSVTNRFITGEEIRALTLERYPGILGRLADDINTEDMELFFEKHPAIENCEVYCTLGGVLHVEVEQKEPVLRVFDRTNKSYYLDREGMKMPLSLKHTAHVLVANGHIDRLKNRGDLFDLAQFINGDLFWRSQIEQIYVDSKGELVLVPRVGDHLIEFGSIENMAVKFRNLKALYQNGWDVREWNMYRKVSLKYNGQIVCSKVK